MLNLFYFKFIQFLYLIQFMCWSFSFSVLHFVFSLFQLSLFLLFFGSSSFFNSILFSLLRLEITAILSTRWVNKCFIDKAAYICSYCCGKEMPNHSITNALYLFAYLYCITNLRSTANSIISCFRFTWILIIDILWVSCKCTRKAPASNWGTG